MEKKIIVKPSFVFKDYFKAYLYLQSRKTSFIIVSIAISIIIILNLINFYLNDISAEEIFSSSFIFILFFPILIIFSVYRYTKKILSNPKLEENITIHFNKDYIEDVGESFNMKYYWKDLKKITEKSDWFLIYVEKNFAKIIRKADLKENQYNELKELFNSIDIKKSLKN